MSDDRPSCDSTVSQGMKTSRVRRAHLWHLEFSGMAPFPLLPRSPEARLTWDFPPAPSTARVTERAQQMTWILKKEPKKLLQPRAIISCGERAGLVGSRGQMWAVICVRGTLRPGVEVTVMPPDHTRPLKRSASGFSR